MNKGKAIKVNINSRVAVDAAFFHKMQPNYSRPSLRDLGVKNKNGISVFDMGAMIMEDRERQKERMQGDGTEDKSCARPISWSPAQLYAVSASKRKFSVCETTENVWSPD